MGAESLIRNEIIHGLEGTKFLFLALVREVDRNVSRLSINKFYIIIRYKQSIHLIQVQ